MYKREEYVLILRFIISLLHILFGFYANSVKYIRAIKTMQSKQSVFKRTNPEPNSLLFPLAPCQVTLEVVDEDDTVSCVVEGGKNTTTKKKKKKNLNNEEITKRAKSTPTTSAEDLSDQFALGLLTFSVTTAKIFKGLADCGRKERNKNEKQQQQQQRVRVHVRVREDQSLVHINTGVVRRAQTWHTSTPENVNDSFSIWSLSDSRPLNERHDEFEDEFNEERPHVKRRDTFMQNKFPNKHEPAE